MLYFQNSKIVFLNMGLIVVWVPLLLFDEYFLLDFYDHSSDVAIKIHIFLESKQALSKIFLGFLM